MRIATLDQLIKAREERRAVVMPKARGWSHRAHPAAFMAQQPGEVLHNLFRIGMFIYKKPKEKQ